MIQLHDRLKLGVVNILSWIGTGLTLQHVQTFVAIAAGIASLIVSITSVMWILTQKRAFEKDRAAKND